MRLDSVESIDSLFLAMFVLVIVGFIIGLIIYIGARLYYKNSMPKNLSIKIFGFSIFYNIFLMYAIFSVIILLVFYGIAFIFGKRDFTFNRFICVHLPITIIILLFIHILGGAQ